MATFPRTNFQNECLKQKLRIVHQRTVESAHLSLGIDGFLRNIFIKMDAILLPESTDKSFSNWMILVTAVQNVWKIFHSVTDNACRFVTLT